MKTGWLVLLWQFMFMHLSYSETLTNTLCTRMTKKFLEKYHFLWDYR